MLILKSKNLVFDVNFMEKLANLFKQLKNNSEDRFNNFDIEPITDIAAISEEAYLEKPTWLGGDEKFVCLFIDLDNSTQISQEKNRVIVAKIYDYFTQNIYDVLTTSGIEANYIDIKGDGLFGIYEGDRAILKSFVAAVTFKTFFEKNIKSKFKDNGIILKCKISINQDKTLVKKIGGRGDFNEVWAGELVNNAFKIASLNKKIYERDVAKINKTKKEDILIVSSDIYKGLKLKEYYTIFSCGHSGGNYTTIGKKVRLWDEFYDSSEDAQYPEKVYYLYAVWCDVCGDKYLNEILK